MGALLMSHLEHPGAPKSRNGVWNLENDVPSLDIDDTG